MNTALGYNGPWDISQVTIVRSNCSSRMLLTTMWAPDNPVRFIDAVVSGLDLAEAGFKQVLPKSTGRPGYDPADLLKLYVYGYLNRIRSSRRLEAETHAISR